MNNQINYGPLLLAKKYRWRGGINSCFEIYDENDNVLFCVWSQFHAIMILILCKRVQKLTSQNPCIKR